MSFSVRATPEEAPRRVAIALAVATLLATPASTAAAQSAPTASFLTGMCAQPDSTPPADLTDLVDTPTQPARQVPGRITPFPAELRRDGYKGTVVIALVVDTTGRARPGSVAVMRSTDPVLSRWACEAAASLRYVPAQLDGKPVAVQITQPFHYAAHVVNVDLR